MDGDGYGWLEIALDGWRLLLIAGDSYGWLEIAKDGLR